MTKYIYIIQHVANEDSPAEDVKLIGAFSSKNKATACVERMKKIKGFKKFHEKFYIDRYILNQAEWSDGFITEKTKSDPYRAIAT